MATDKTINNIKQLALPFLWQVERITFLHTWYHLGKKIWHWVLALWCRSMHCRCYFFGYRWTAGPNTSFPSLYFSVLWNLLIQVMLFLFSRMKSKFTWSFTDWVETAEVCVSAAVFGSIFSFSPDKLREHRHADFGRENRVTWRKRSHQSEILLTGCSLSWDS